MHRCCEGPFGSRRPLRCYPWFDEPSRKPVFRSPDRLFSARSSRRRWLREDCADRRCRREERRSRPGPCRSSLRCSRFGDQVLPSITVLSTSPSGPTRTTLGRRRSIRAAARSCSRPCWHRRSRRTSLLRKLPHLRAGPRAFWGPQRRSERRSRSSRGRRGIPRTHSPGHSRGRGSSCNGASPPRSRRMHRSRSQMRPETPASPWSSNAVTR